MENGLLNTLVQFYDPLHHCFTFPDYQLMPTLEEYSYLVGLSISNQIPFSGLEEDSAKKKRKAQVDLFSSSPILPADYSNVLATSDV